MLEVEEIEDGVFKVTFTAMHYEWLDNASKSTSVHSESILALWIGCGVSSMPELCLSSDQPDTRLPASSEPVEGGD